MRLTDHEDLIAASISRTIGPRPVILCGSRATGDATDESDYDVYVVFPTLAIPPAIARLRGLSRDLEARLGVRVTINPLPRFRLHHPGPSLLVWKIRREGRVLAAPPGFELGTAETPNLSSDAASSYAISAIRYLTAKLEPRELDAQPGTTLQRAMRKAVLHLAQLELLRQGTYASRLDEALELLVRAQAQGLFEIVDSLDHPEAWFSTRDLLLDELDGKEPGWAPALFSNTQYVALTALSGAGFQLRAIRVQRAVRTRLEQAEILLARAVQPGGTLDAAMVAGAARLLPRWILPSRQPTWAELRDAVEQHWPQANPLLGL